MFGFPESPSDWTSKDYLRLFVIIMFYISVRPLLQALYSKLGERQRARQKKDVDDELIERHRLERESEKKGSSEAETKVTEEAKSTSVQSSKPSLRQRREARSKKKESEMEKILEQMPADEDVSDLIG